MLLDEPAAPRPGRGALLAELGREDLDNYAVEELQERIAGLEAEIDRVRTRLKSKQSGRAAADALFAASASQL
jgi:uncharacterized small protein (DUF1192 family)